MTNHPNRSKHSTMTNFERAEAGTTVGYWTISRAYPGASGQYTYTGSDFSGGMTGGLRYPSAAEAEAAMAAARQVADALYADIGRTICVHFWHDYAASVAATARKLRDLRTAARQDARTIRDRVLVAVEAEYYGLRHFLLPLPDASALDDWRSYPARAVACAASRISEAYGLGLGSEWAARNFGMGGNETAALAGHVGIDQARQMTGVETELPLTEM